MKFHPAANAFPLMDDAALDELAADIREHGLREPILLADGQIVDGRNRYLACQRAGIEPMFENVDTSQSIPELVWSLNSVRRHLTPSQRAAVAVKLLPTLEAEARERNKTAKEKIPEAEQGQARDKAAEIVGVNAHYVSDAKRLHDNKPALFEKIQNGELSISQAASIEALGKRIDQFPKDEQASADKFLNGIIADGNSPGIAIRVADNLLEKPVEDRLRIYTLNESDNERERAIARSEAANVPPPPLPAVLHLTEAGSAIARAARHVNGDLRKRCHALRSDLGDLIDAIKSEDE